MSEPTTLLPSPSCDSTAADDASARVRQSRWLTVLTAMAAATALGGLLDPVLGIDLVVGRGASERRVENLAITLTALAVGLSGWALLELLERWVARPRRAWTVVAVLVLALSLLGPLGARSGQATAALLALHVVVGSILVRGLRRSGEGR